MNMNPYIVTDGNGQEAVSFYERVLGAEVLTLQVHEELNLVIHAHLKVGNSDLMISDNFPGPHQEAYQVGNNVTIAITTKQTDITRNIFDQLLENGKEVLALQESFFSPLYGQVTDPFGITWHVSTYPET